MSFDFVVCISGFEHVFWWRRAHPRRTFPLYMFVQIPGAFIWETGRYNSETDQVIDWFYIGHDLVIWQNCFVNSRWSRELGQRYSSGIPRTKRKMFVLRSSKCAVLCEIDVLDFWSCTVTFVLFFFFWIHYLLKLRRNSMLISCCSVIIAPLHGDPTKYKQYKM